MLDDAAEDDRHPGYASWRQFHGLRLDLPAPDGLEIDARLRIYQRANEAGALRDFGAALLLVAAIGRALLDGARIFTGMNTVLEALVFGLTCALLVIVGVQALQRLQRAMEQRALVRGIGLDSLPWHKVESLFADTREAEVRDYLQSVREQGRALRRAEVAVALERANGRLPLDGTDMDGFARHLRYRKGSLTRQIITACACLAALLLAGTAAVEGRMFLPAMILFGGWALSGLLGSLLQLLMDPWELRAGGADCRRIRAAVAADVFPELAVALAVLATSVRLLGGG